MRTTSSSCRRSGRAERHRARARLSRATPLLSHRLPLIAIEHPAHIAQRVVGNIDEIAITRLAARRSRRRCGQRWGTDADGDSWGGGRVKPVQHERISSRPMATHPQVGLPSVTWRKIPDTRPGMRCGFTAMLTA